MKTKFSQANYYNIQVTSLKLANNLQPNRCQVFRRGYNILDTNIKSKIAISVIDKKMKTSHFHFTVCNSHKTIFREFMLRV